MGDHKTFHDLGRESSGNGHADVYGATNWRDYIVTRRPEKKISGGMILLSFDVVLSILFILKILPMLTVTGQIAAWVGIFYLVGRFGFLALKFVVYWVRNNREIKKFFRGFKDHFNER